MSIVELRLDIAATLNTINNAFLSINIGSLAQTKDSTILWGTEWMGYLQLISLEL